MTLDLATRATGGYPADLRNGAGIKIDKVGLRADISLDLSQTQKLDAAPAGGLVPVQDPTTGRIQALDFSKLPTSNPADGSVANIKLTAAPPLTVKGNATEASAQPQDVSLSTLASTGNPLGDAIDGRAPKASPELTGTAKFETLSTSAAGVTNPNGSVTVKSADGTLKFKFPSWQPPNTLSEEFAGSIETGPISIDLVRTGGFGSYGNIYLTSLVKAPTPQGQFDFGLGCYMSAGNLVGGGAGGAWIGVNSPSTGEAYGGGLLNQVWTRGSVSAMEINTGNRWGELGQQRDWNRADRWTNGITIVPAIVPSTDGPGNNAYNGTFGTSLLKDSLSPAKWWTGHLVGRDAIVPLGTAYQVNGGLTAQTAYDIINVEGFFRVGIDLTAGTFQSSPFQSNGFSVGNRGNITSLAEVSAFTYISSPQTPASATAPGTRGQWVSDANYFYVCVATNTWKRVAIATW